MPGRSGGLPVVRLGEQGGLPGHDVQAIYDAIQNAYAKKGVPSCIVLDTCKGKGATFAEPKHDHSSQPNEEQWAEAIAASEKALEAVKNA